MLQNEITAETSEVAFLSYLEKLDQVSRLELCAMYRELEKQTQGGTGRPAVNILHVFGRTKGKPHIYYYRRFDNYEWTPWERVDVDIEGDHLLPVVWNRRLHVPAIKWPRRWNRTQGVPSKLPTRRDRPPATDWKRRS